ncbi:MAG: hypothetical protein ABWY93_22695 [Mycobacterium sp.]
MNEAMLLMDEGAPVAEISAAAILGAFVVWGVLMGVAGAGIAWVMRSDRISAEQEDREFAAGNAPVVSAADDTTIIIPSRRHVAAAMGATHRAGRVGIADARRRRGR